MECAAWGVLVSGPSPICKNADFPTLIILDSHWLNINNVENGHWPHAQVNCQVSCPSSEKQPANLAASTLDSALVLAHSSQFYPSDARRLSNTIPSYAGHSCKGFHSLLGVGEY